MHITPILRAMRSSALLDVALSPCNGIPLSIPSSIINANQQYGKQLVDVAGFDLLNQHDIGCTPTPALPRSRGRENP